MCTAHSTGLPKCGRKGQRFKNAGKRVFYNQTRTPQFFESSKYLMVRITHPTWLPTNSDPISPAAMTRCWSNDHASARRDYNSSWRHDHGSSGNHRSIGSGATSPVHAPRANNGMCNRNTRQHQQKCNEYCQVRFHGIFLILC